MILPTSLLRVLPSEFCNAGPIKWCKSLMWRATEHCSLFRHNTWTTAHIISRSTEKISSKSVHKFWNYLVHRHRQWTTFCRDTDDTGWCFCGVNWTTLLVFLLPVFYILSFSTTIIIVINVILVDHGKYFYSLCGNCCQNLQLIFCRLMGKHAPNWRRDVIILTSDLWCPAHIGDAGYHIPSLNQVWNS